MLAWQVLLTGVQPSSCQNRGLYVWWAAGGERDAVLSRSSSSWCACPVHGFSQSSSGKQ